MNSKQKLQFEEFAERIKKENINIKGKYRRYSNKLKWDVLNYISKNKISNSAAANELGIAGATICDWKRALKIDRNFSKISILQDNTNKNIDTYKTNLGPIMRNQVFLLLLLGLLLTERLSHYLVEMHTDRDFQELSHSLTCVPSHSYKIWN